MARRGAKTPKITLGFKFNGLSLRFPKVAQLHPDPLRAAKAKALLERSEQKRLRSIMKKFDKAKAIELGVPKEVFDAADRAAARHDRKREIKAARAKQSL